MTIDLNNNIEQIEQKLDAIAKHHSNSSYDTARPALSVKSMDSSKDQFEQFIRKGDKGDLVTKAYTTNPDDGGVVVHPSLYNKIMGAIKSRSAMRQLASIETISSGIYDLVVQQGGFAASWGADGAERDETETPKLLKKKIYVHELFAQPKASQRLIDDSAINIENWLAENLRDSFGMSEEEAFIKGDGDQKPFGILARSSDDTDIKMVNSDEGICLEDLMHMVASMQEQYLAGATFLMHRHTLTAIQQIKDSLGRFVWQRSVAENMPDTILGIPVMCSDAMPTDDHAVVLADFKAAYKIVERSGMSLLRDPYTDKPFVKFYAVKRVGGDVANDNALRILRQSS